MSENILQFKCPVCKIVFAIELDNDKCESAVNKAKHFLSKVVENHIKKEHSIKYS